jgi:hypothetical protein
MRILLNTGHVIDFLARLGACTVHCAIAAVMMKGCLSIIMTELKNGAKAHPPGSHAPFLRLSTAFCRRRQQQKLPLSKNLCIIAQNTPLYLLN